MVSAAPPGHRPRFHLPARFGRIHLLAQSPAWWQCRRGAPGGRRSRGGGRRFPAPGMRRDSGFKRCHRTLRSDKGALCCAPRPAAPRSRTCAPFPPLAPFSVLFAKKLGRCSVLKILSLCMWVHSGCGFALLRLILFLSFCQPGAEASESRSLPSCQH